MAANPVAPLRAKRHPAHVVSGAAVLGILRDFPEPVHQGLRAWLIQTCLRGDLGKPVGFFTLRPDFFILGRLSLSLCDFLHWRSAEGNLRQISPDTLDVILGVIIRHRGSKVLASVSDEAARVLAVVYRSSRGNSHWEMRWCAKTDGLLKQNLQQTTNPCHVV